MPMTSTATNTTSVVCSVSWRVGQTTLRSSTREPCTNCQNVAALHRLQRDQDADAERREHDHPAHRERIAREQVETRHAAEQDRGGCGQFHGVQRTGTSINLVGHLLLPAVSPHPSPGIPWSRVSNGRPGGNRTPNLRFWRPPLCQLSYWPAREPGIRTMDRAAVYFRILETTPAPTVRPPSRIAKRRPSSIAIGLISSIVILMLSPGITISTPSGNSTEPVTSVVRK